MFRFRRKRFLLEFLIFTASWNIPLQFCEAGKETSKSNSGEDDQLITKLLDVPLMSKMTGEESSDVSHILRILEAGELTAAASSTTKAPPPPPTTLRTTQKPSTTSTTMEPTTIGTTSEAVNSTDSTSLPITASNVTTTILPQKLRTSVLESDIDDNGLFSHSTPEELEELDQKLDSIISSLLGFEPLLKFTESTISNIQSKNGSELSPHFTPLDYLLLKSSASIQDMDLDNPSFHQRSRSRSKTGRKKGGRRSSSLSSLAVGDSTIHRRVRRHGWGWGDEFEYDYEPIYLKHHHHHPHHPHLKILPLLKSLKAVVLTKILLKKKLIALKLVIVGKIIAIVKATKFNKIFHVIHVIKHFLWKCLFPHFFWW